LEKLRETLKVRKERAILVAAPSESASRVNGLAELTALVESAGAIVIDTFQQKIRSINPVTYIGKGKASQLAQKVKRNKADVVIFNNDLSPRQIRELEKTLQVKVLDRSELILDIFATKAKTRQAKLQVELAQLEYTFPRLTRMWSHLDSVAGAGGATAAGSVGGIGTRGPGEKQLEIDRRLVSKRITELKRELSKIDGRRVHEISRRKGLYKICLVGYTNAGKTTLLNKLTNADAFVEDRLFATLDTRTRKWHLAKGAEVLLSDTIGFVKNLPHQLIASFKATLEEAITADLLLHVVDISNPLALNQIESVKKVLSKIGCNDRPILTALNKVDVVRKIGHLEMLRTLFPDALCISAKTSLGLEELTETVLKKYKGCELLLRVNSSQENGKVQSFLRAYGTVLQEKYSNGYITIDVKLGQKQLPGLKRLQPKNIKIVQG